VAIRRAQTHPRLERDTPIPTMNQQMPRSARHIDVDVIKRLAPSSDDLPA
jgi:hypothetical protein